MDAELERLKETTADVLKDNNMNVLPPLVAEACVKAEAFVKMAKAQKGSEDVVELVAEGQKATLKRSLELGINHFETARVYGCSELMLGIALRKLFDAADEDHLSVEMKQTLSVEGGEVLRGAKLGHRGSPRAVDR